MPIHDWTRVRAGLFHHFHQDWSVEIARALNRGLLPAGLYALVEQRVRGPEPDIIAVETNLDHRALDTEIGVGVAVLERPKTRVVRTIESDEVNYARRANRISIRHELGDVVAVIEILSPGNKSSRAALRDFVDKAVDFLRAGVHLLLVDLFPPSVRDPDGIHNAIADAFFDPPIEIPTDQPLTLVGYDAGKPPTAYLETLAIGAVMPDMPLFIAHGEHIPVPLEATYQATWQVTPKPIRDMLESTVASNLGAGQP